MLELPVVEQDPLLLGINRDSASSTPGDAERFEMARCLAQVGTGFVDIAFKQVGNRHA